MRRSPGGVMNHREGLAVASRRIGPVPRALSLIVPLVLCGGALAAPVDSGKGPPPPDPARKPAHPMVSLQEVVVTGTLLRNAAPVGSTVITLDQAALNATGGNTVFDQLQSLPQIDNLGVTEASRTGTGGAININYGTSINIRGLSPFATLTLVDGHRVPPAGTSGSTVDPNSFPAIMVERVDVVADGASATYGSDAIAGVANIILRRDVEGVEVRARSGWANGYMQRSLGIVAGHDWGSGQLTLGYENSFHTALSGLNRAFFRSDQTALGGSNYETSQCNPGTIVAGGTTYAIPPGGVTPATAGQLIPGTMNQCDVAKYQDILPRVSHSDVALTFDQRMGDRISMYADATYSKRAITNRGGRSTAQLEVPTTNPYFVAPPGAVLSPCSPVPGAPNCEQVNYWFGPDAGTTVPAIGFSINYQATIGFNFDLSHGWSLSVDGTAGRDHDQDENYNLDNGALQAALDSTSPATAFNAFGGANSSALVANLFDSLFLAPGYSGEQVAEAKINGPAFRMPGGEVRVAIGGQWQHDDLTYGVNNGPAGHQLVLRQVLNRHSKSAFAEVLFPFFGTDNAVTGIQRLDVDLAARYSNYSDVGSTTNPKIGINWKPVKTVTVSGTFGTSFRAPLLSELVGPLKGVFVQTYSDPLSPGGTSVGYTLGGGNLQLKPEKANTYTFGVKYQPSPRARVNVDYFNIDYKNQISSYLSDLTILQQPAELGSLITRCPSAACTALVNQYVLGTGPNASPEPVFGPIIPNPSVFVNGEELNLGRTRAAGFDFQGQYVLPRTRMGIWSAGLSGSWFTRYDVRFTPSGRTFNERNVIGFPPALRLRGNVGLTSGPWDAQLFLNFVNSYKNTETTPTQTVGSYTTLDLNVIYDFGLVFQGGWAQSLKLDLNVLNLGNTDPPYVDIPISPNGGGGFDPNVGNPIGRMISVQLQKTF
jgi:iron complex outermembrane receptor protein